MEVKDEEDERRTPGTQSGKLAWEMDTVGDDDENRTGAKEKDAGTPWRYPGLYNLRKKYLHSKDEEWYKECPKHGQIGWLVCGLLGITKKFKL